MSPDLKQWLTRQCNKLMNGECRTGACLKRGGYIRGEPSTLSINRATCEALEIHNIIDEHDKSVERKCK